MDYLEMTSAIPGNRTALIENGNCYTYGDLCGEARGIRNRSRQDPVRSAHGLMWVKETSIYRQLVHFLAYSGTAHVPVILPENTRPGPLCPTEEDARPGSPCPTADMNISQNACMGVMTSGTTGAPRLWFRTFESWYSFFPVQNRIFGIDSSTRMMVHGSLAFTGNLNMYLSLLSEGAAIITSTPVHPPDWNRAMTAYDANAVYMIPSKLCLLARTCPAPNNRVTAIISGSQSLGSRAIKALESAYPGSQCVLYYGASELSFVSYIRGSQIKDRQTCVGIPFPGVHISIRNDQITVDTPYRVLDVPTPYTVGDLGWIDPDGLLHLLGRKDNVYNIHGRKISGSRIENTLLALESVETAAVVLEQDVLTAYIVPAPPRPAQGEGEFTQKIIKELKYSLESYELPRRIFCVEQLPGRASDALSIKML